MNIGLALGGGGNRAAVFHLGVLARLAIDENDLFPQVARLSTVSGGSLVVGLIYALNKYKWPSGQEYLKLLPETRRIFTTYDMQLQLIAETLLHLETSFSTRAHNLSRLLQTDWGITVFLKDIPVKPHWAINSCCYETGKIFRFGPADTQYDFKENVKKPFYKMADYRFGYADADDFLLADALAASAGFPVAIGFLPLDTQKYTWLDRREDFGEDGNKIKNIHLWDGGAYDNQGFEALMDIQTGWRGRQQEKIEFLLASDASDKPHTTSYRSIFLSIYRLATGIMMEQVGELRTRAFLHHIISHGSMGSFIQIGNTCEYILNQANEHFDDIRKHPELVPAGKRMPDFIPTRQITKCSPLYLSKDEAESAAHTPTGLQKFFPDEYERLFRHGYEVADCTLYAYYGEHTYQSIEFQLIGYAALKSRWGPSRQP